MDRGRTLACGIAAALALPGAALAGSSPRAADSFTGHVTAARGHWSHDHGRLSVRLTPTGTGRTRHLAIRLTGTRCATQKACLVLNGKLSGTITTKAPWHPDAGSRFTIVAGGTVTPLGVVHATGTVAGTGYIYRGRVTLRLTLTNRRGAVTLTAASGPVPGFTSP